MPNWMEAVASEVPEEEISDLKIILRFKIYPMIRFHVDLN